jgi:hypothetical protein
MFFHRGWLKFFKNIIYNITGEELLDGWSSKQKRGVYIILSINYSFDEVDIEYIGSSQNMKNRLYHSNHDVYDKLRKKEDHVIFSFPIFYIDTPKYLEIEKLLIKSLRPKLNKQHNNG